ncbi:MAG: hypothetical protein BZY83_01535 [SAR202 cluster bacterium Casp-Chloro-G2]|nr:MAG: hypothetical protein BZY83_01535 [SAR202 cluster bacterium Casp-Chloro-G2]
MGIKKASGIRGAEGSDRQIGVMGYFMIGGLACQEDSGWIQGLRSLIGRVKRLDSPEYVGVEAQANHE